MEAGTVDIVIGTHRLVQPDVKFKDLGLLVIDEEHGSEWLTRRCSSGLRLAVDVLTLSARRFRGRCTCRCWGFAISRT